LFFLKGEKSKAFGSSKDWKVLCEGISASGNRAKGDVQKGGRPRKREEKEGSRFIDKKALLALGKRATLKCVRGATSSPRGGAVDDELRKGRHPRKEEQSSSTEGGREGSIRECSKARPFSKRSPPVQQKESRLALVGENSMSPNPGGNLQNSAGGGLEGGRNQRSLDFIVFT